MVELRIGGGGDGGGDGSDESSGNDGNEKGTGGEILFRNEVEEGADDEE